MPDVEIANALAGAPLLIVCDHAGRRVPPSIDLGIGDAELSRHIGWDIGAADLARELARLLDAPLILNHVSRLVIDANRRPGLPSSIPVVADGCAIPANQELTVAAARKRVAAFWLPYHRAIARRLAASRRLGTVPALIAVHSYTPELAGVARPWHLGVLSRGDMRLATPLLAALGRHEELVVGDNLPYSGLVDFGFTLEFHAQRTGLPHVMVEVRQDEIATRPRAQTYAHLIAAALDEPLRAPGLHRLWPDPELARGWRGSHLAAHA